MSSVGLILLAAGGSSRMGRAKGLLVFEGRTLIRRAAEVAVASGCSPVVVVLGGEVEGSRAEVAGLPVRVVVNDRWASGMGSSIRCGMEAVLRGEPGVGAVAVMLCDQPYVDAAVIGRLIEVWRGGAAEVASGYAGTVGPPCLFSVARFGELLALEDGRGAKALLGGAVVVGFEAGAMDVDTPSDFERLGAPLDTGRKRPG